MLEQKARNFLNSEHGKDFLSGSKGLYAALGRFIAETDTSYEIPNPVPLAEAVQRLEHKFK